MKIAALIDAIREPIHAIAAGLPPARTGADPQPDFEDTLPSVHAADESAGCFRGVGTDGGSHVVRCTAGGPATAVPGVSGQPAATAERFVPTRSRHGESSNRSLV
jgi:hypothetical protein